MKRLNIAPVTVVALLALAACGGGAYDSKAPPTAAPTRADTPIVTVENLGASGRVLVDSAGKPLYAADEEADGAVVCTGTCASFWIPLTVGGDPPSEESVQRQLGVAPRGDGARQVTFAGMRLYSFVQDGPGEVTGDGFSDAFDGQQFTWHVVGVEDMPDSIPEDGDSSGSVRY